MFHGFLRNRLLSTFTHVSNGFLMIFKCLLFGSLGGMLRFLFGLLPLSCGMKASWRPNDRVRNVWRALVEAVFLPFTEPSKLYSVSKHLYDHCRRNHSERNVWRAVLWPFTWLVKPSKHQNIKTSERHNNTRNSIFSKSQEKPPG